MRKASVIAVLVAAGAVVLATTAAGTAQAPPTPRARRTAAGRTAAGTRWGRHAGGGRAERQAGRSIAAAADRGRRVWASECIDCHGTQARGGDKGPNLVRSVVVLRDRYGSQLGPFLKKGHPMQSGTPSASLTDAQISRPRALPAAAGQRHAARLAAVQGPEHPDRRCRRPARPTSTARASAAPAIADRRPGRHRRAARAGGHPAAVPVPGHRPRRTRPRRAPRRAEPDRRHA